jgi:SAM-dependent methyltransferase
MSHPEQLEFMRLAYSSLPHSLKSGKYLEIGSYDVNGTIRNVFEHATEYIGVDLKAGPGVDLVCFGHEVLLPDSTFDVSVSAECFEHDEHWVATFRNMVRLTKPGGVIIFSCASSGRPEHGTRRSDPKLSPGTQDLGLDYYKNLSESDFRSEIEFEDLFSDHHFWYLPSHGDLYFMGQISNESTITQTIKFPSKDIMEIRKLMSLPHRLVRVPLRITNRLLPEPAFQSFAARYWKYLTRVQERVLGNSFSR